MVCDEVCEIVPVVVWVVDVSDVVCDDVAVVVCEDVCDDVCELVPVVV